MTFLSCSKDKDEHSKADLSGVWEIENMVIDGEPYTLSECELRSTLNFSNNKIMNTSYFTNTDNECQFTEVEFTYMLDGSELVIESSKEMEYSGILLNPNTLQLNLTWGSVTTIETYTKR